MTFVQKFNEILKDYCLNCSLAGLSYIADNRFVYIIKNNNKFTNNSIFDKL